MIRAIIFDMDGVLIDARDWHYEALNRALRRFGYEIGLEEHLSTFDGLPTARKLTMLSEMRGLPRALHPEINRLKQAFTAELVAERCRPISHHRHALASLKEAGFLLAVASNAIRASVDMMMEKAELAEFLDVTMSNEDVVLPKPHPDIFLKCCARLGVKPGEAVVVEDSEYGVRSARSAGCHVLRVAHVDEVKLDIILDFVFKADSATALRQRA